MRLLLRTTETARWSVAVTVCLRPLLGLRSLNRKSISNVSAPRLRVKVNARAWCGSYTRHIRNALCPSKSKCKVCRSNDAEEQLHRGSSELASHATVAVEVVHASGCTACSIVDLGPQNTLQLTRSAHHQAGDLQKLSLSALRKAFRLRSPASTCELRGKPALLEPGTGGCLRLLFTCQTRTAGVEGGTRSTEHGLHLCTELPFA